MMKRTSFLDLRRKDFLNRRRIRKRHQQRRSDQMLPLRIAKRLLHKLEMAADKHNAKRVEILLRRIRRVRGIQHHWVGR